MAMDLVARLSLKDDGFSSRMQRATRSLSDVERKTRSVSSGFSSLTKTMAGVGAAIGVTALLSKGIGMVKGSIDSAFKRIDTMESFERVLTTLTGSAEKTAAALDATREAVTGTAYGLDVAAKGVQDFVTRGMDVDKATKTMAAWGDAVAFYGNGSNDQLAGVSDALAKMYSSGKVGMDQMNRLYDAGIDGVGMYAKATGQNVNSVQKRLSKGVISAKDFIDVVTDAMMNGTRGVVNIAGAAKKAGASWGASFDNMRAAVTRGVTSIIQTIDTLLKDNGLPTMRAMIAEFGKRFETALKKAATLISPLVDKLKALYKVIEPYIPIIKKVATAIGIAVAAIAGFFSVVSAFKLLGSALLFLTSPIGLVIGAITGLVLGFQHFYKSSEPFRTAIDKIVGGVKGLFAALGGNNAKSVDIMQKAGLSVDQIGKVTEFANGIKKAINTVKTYITGVFSAFKTGDAGGILSALGFSPEVIAKIFAFINVVKTKANEFVAYLKSKWEAIQPGIATLMQTFTMFKDNLVNVFTSLWGFSQPIFGALMSAFQILADIVVIAFNNVIMPVIRNTMATIQLMWKIVGPILKLLGSAIGLAFEVLRIAWDTVIKPFVNFMTTVFKKAFDLALPVIQKLGDAFDVVGGVISKIAGWLNDFTGALKSFKVPNWLSKLGGGGTVKFEETGGGTSKGNSHYNGIDYVPYDGYQISAHKGERLQTAQEVREGKAGGGSPISISGNTFHVRQESDIPAIAMALAKLIEQEGGQMA